MNKLSVTLPDRRTLWFKDHRVDEEKINRLEYSGEPLYPIRAFTQHAPTLMYRVDGKSWYNRPNGWDLIPCEPDEAPAPDTDYERLRSAVRDVYYAGHWTCPSVADPDALWKRLRDAARFEPGKAPDPVAHPISAEHPLVVGDVVRHSITKEAATVTRLDETGWAEAVFESGLGRWWHPTKGHSEYTMPRLFVTRIAHAPTAEPHDFTHLTDQQVRANSLPEFTITAHPAAEADQANPRLMQATDEQLQAEIERRKNTPKEKVKELRKILYGLVGFACTNLLDEFEQFVREDEQEGGSHE